MARLYWKSGWEQGPATTQELANVIEAEGALISGLWVTGAGQRCLWGVINDHYLAHAENVLFRFQGCRRILTEESRELLYDHNLSMKDSDSFLGSPKERCQEMVRRLRAIP